MKAKTKCIKKMTMHCIDPTICKNINMTNATLNLNKLYQNTGLNIILILVVSPSER